jgi:fluoroacetyl-CoA thioesterase
VKASLKAGLKHRLIFKVIDSKTVPALFPESGDFLNMPSVFATGYMVGLFEWCCTELLAQHLDDGEGSLGVVVNFTHDAATPPGMTVTVDCEITEVEGKRVNKDHLIQDFLEDLAVGDVVQLTMMRRGKKFIASVALTERK